MKFTTLKIALEEEGYKIVKFKDSFNIMYKDDLIGYIDDTLRYRITFYTNDSNKMNDDVYRHLCNYAATPLDQRHDEKKYKYKLKLPYEIESFYSWLNFDLREKKFHLTTQNNHEK